MHIWDQAKGTKEELIHVKIKLEIIELGHAVAELDRSVVEDTHEMLQCLFDCSIPEMRS